MYRDIPVEDRAIPIAFDAAATQDLHTEEARTPEPPVSPTVGSQRREPYVWGDGAPEPEDPSQHPTDDAPSSDGGYVIPIRKRRRRA